MSQHRRRDAIVTYLLAVAIFGCMSVTAYGTASPVG